MKNKNIFRSLDINSYNLRNKISIAIPQHNTSFFEHQTYYSAVTLFNALPTYLQKIESNIRLFRKQLKIFLINNEFYRVKDFLMFKKNS